MIIQRQAQIVTLGDPMSSELLLVLHGYGQLAEYFIRRFEAVQDRYLIVAPEGPHRFYLKGFSGRVGASWMTKEKRDWDIADNMLYLDQVIEHFGAGKRITLLGFSQGGATAARYVVKGKFDIAHFISWASGFPTEIETEFQTRMQGKSLDFVLGDQDPFFDEIAKNEAQAYYKKLGFTLKSFEGIHDIESKTLCAILNISTFGTLSANDSENNY